ncbi:MAG: PEP-CTERM sorting domain-containing protein [Burkholderiaceae bacterium]
MKLQSIFLTAAILVASSVAGAAEFWQDIPTDGTSINGNLRNDKANGGGFSGVNVTGYNGVGGQFDGYFWTGAASPTPADAFFRFFCIQLSEHATVGPVTYAASVLNDDDLRKLYDVAYPNDTAADFWNSGKTNFGEFSSATMSAAFQVAVWNIVFDNDLDLASGSFKWTGASSAVSTAAQGLLDQVASYSATSYTHWTLYQFVNRGQQDYVAATYRVPEPGALGLLGLGLLAAALAGRRRRR